MSNDLVAPRLVTKTEDRRGDPKVVELLKTYAKEYYRKNRDVILANEKRRRLADPELFKKRKSEDAKRWAKSVAGDPKKLRLYLWKRARSRAQLQHLAFDISPDDVVIPETCPVFGFKLESAYGKGIGRGAQNAQPNSPTLDRLEPAKGYVKGNIYVISQRANVLKRDASLQELEQLVCWLRRVTQ